VGEGKGVGLGEGLAEVGGMARGGEGGVAITTAHIDNTMRAIAPKK
jgi:hypothetical protein